MRSSIKGAVRLFLIFLRSRLKLSRRMVQYFWTSVLEWAMRVRIPSDLAEVAAARARVVTS